jgi:hypothetical protein
MDKITDLELLSLVKEVKSKTHFRYLLGYIDS